LLVRRGSIGYVQQIGRFLQDQIIYGVHFVDQGGRLVGCREQELIPAAAPWVPSRFDTRDRVYASLDLAIQGRVVVSAGSIGQIIAVLRQTANGVQYQVRFAAHTLQVPESALTAGVAEITAPVVGQAVGN
jgi:nitrogen fixation protein NifZ